MAISWVRICVGVGIGVALVTAVTLSYRHYVGLVDDNSALSAKVATLQGDAERASGREQAYREAIGKWDEAADRQARALEDLTRAQANASTYAAELKDLLSSHDLGALALRKPGLVQDRVNAGTARALGLLSRATQAPAAGDAGPAADRPVGTARPVAGPARAATVAGRGGGG